MYAPYAVVLDLVVGDEYLETTPEHPFFTAMRGWVDAQDLQAGALVRQADGDYGAVQAVGVALRTQPMYNLTVATAHTFFVVDGQWLVHNAVCPYDKKQHSGDLDLALGGVVGDGMQAQHLIPTELSANHGRPHPLMVLADRMGWNNDAAYNGVLLPDNRRESIIQNVAWHNGSHSNYTKLVENILDDMHASGVYDQNNIIPGLKQLTSDLRVMMKTYVPGTRLR